MSYDTSHIRQVSVDYTLVALVTLTVVFQIGTVAAVRWFEGLTFTTTQTTDVRVGAGLLAIVVVESLAIVFLWRLYNRLSERWQRVVKYLILGLFATLAAGLAYIVYQMHGWERVIVNIGLGVLAYVAVKYDLGGNYRWIAFNAIAIGGGMLITAVMGTTLSPPVVIVFMILMIVWDKIAVDLSSLMGDLVDFSSSVSIPNFVVIPTQLQLDLATVRDLVGGELTEKPDSVAFIIGVGDLFFPALLTASAIVAYTSTWPAVGAFAGTLVATVVLKAELDTRETGAPGLPWLNSGAIGGFAVGMVPVIL